MNQFRVRIDSSSTGDGPTWGKIDLTLVNLNGHNETFSLTQEAEELREGGHIQVWRG